MTIAALKKFQSAKPFRPYRLRWVDGRDIIVAYPECLGYRPPRLRGVGVAGEDGGMTMIDLHQITTITLIRRQIDAK